MAKVYGRLKEYRKRGLLSKSSRLDLGKIKEDYLSGKVIDEIAADFGVAPSAVWVKLRVAMTEEEIQSARQARLGRRGRRKRRKMNIPESGVHESAASAIDTI